MADRRHRGSVRDRDLLCRVAVVGERADGGGEIGALAVNCAGEGLPTMLSIRPERVLIGQPDAPNRMDGKVVELIYLGDHIRCRMEVAGHDDFIVKVPNSSSHAALNVGETTPIGWVTDDCRALDAA